MLLLGVFSFPIIFETIGVSSVTNLVLILFVGILVVRVVPRSLGIGAMVGSRVMCCLLVCVVVPCELPL
jgi:hypothetical protein